MTAPGLDGMKEVPRSMYPSKPADGVATRQKMFYGWKILIVFWLLLAVNLGFTTYGASILNTAMAEAERFDAKGLGLAFSAFMLMLGLPAPLVAITLNRLGLRASIIIGTILIVAGAVAMATIVRTPLAAAIAYGLTLGMGVAFGGTLPTQVGIGRWFVRRRAMALSIMFSANGIGGLIAAPILNQIITISGDWRAGWLVLAFLSLIVGLAALVVVRENPASVGQLPDGGEQRGAAPPPRVHITAIDFTVAQAIRTRAYWCLAVASGLNFIGLSLVLSHGVANLRSLGHTQSEAALAVSLLSGATLLGKLLLGLPGDRVEPQRLWVVASLLIALGIATAPFATTVPMMLAYALLFGMGFGGYLVMQSATMLNYFGIKPFASLVSVILLVQTGASAAVPFAAGALQSHFGGYFPVFIGAATLALLAVPLLILAKPPLAR